MTANIDLINGFAACFAYVFVLVTMLGLMMVASNRNPKRTDKHIRILFFTKWRRGSKWD